MTVKAHPRFYGLRESHVQSGQSTVEIALALPTLLVLLMGIVVAGLVFYAFIQVSNAAREGARAGAVCRLTTDVADCPTSIKWAICDPTNNGLSSLGYLAPAPAANCATSRFNVNRDVIIASSGDLADPRQGDQITVQLIYSYTVPIASSFVPMFPKPIVIRRSVMMEVQ